MKRMIDTNKSWYDRTGDTAAVIQEGNNAVQSANVLVHVGLVESKTTQEALDFITSQPIKPGSLEVEASQLSQ
jgi:hypothetical protein